MSKSTLACLYAFVCIAICIVCAIAASKTEVGGWWVPAVIFALTSFMFASFSIDHAAK